ncbi:YidC/Oxa1 family membrane protein insertase [Leifsonia sp. AK011]|uniref:YidC/Oxa1 family membrane protein insertase n=1 Tax=Leifsonia sp. AK011 TaxID=2723075 RepID=UPI0015CBF205|nr:YidC/Oxa1 family membrane protein insertase [Leifsonia sp. AK011]NYF11137.1 YidC/Oxa1 family membrane protein insertase [Leifsonia sp. AK011]
MNLYAFPPIAAALDAAHSAITWLIAALEPLVPAGAAGLAIVLVTVLIRTALIPASVSTVRGEIARRRLAPQIARLRKRYGKQPEMLQRKTMELYSNEKVSPFAGILPLLIQAPVLSLLYGLFVLTTIGGHANALLAETFLGVPLGTSLVSAIGTGGDPAQIAVYAVLLLAIGVVAWFSRRATASYLGESAVDTPPGMQRLSGIFSWLPFLTVVFAAIVPLAAAIYLAVTTTWTLVERQLLRRALA